LLPSQGTWPLNNTKYATVTKVSVLNVATANNFTSRAGTALAFMAIPSHAVIDITTTHTCVSM
jgi:hypothetical protein